MKITTKKIRRRLKKKIAEETRWLQSSATSTTISNNRDNDGNWISVDDTASDSQRN